MHSRIPSALAPGRAQHKLYDNGVGVPTDHWASRPTVRRVLSVKIQSSDAVDLMHDYFDCSDLHALLAATKQNDCHTPKVSVLHYLLDQHAAVRFNTQFTETCWSHVHLQLPARYTLKCLL